MVFVKEHKTNLGRKTGIYKNCVECNKKFYITMWNENKRWCSKKCMYNSPIRRNNLSKKLKNHPCYKNPERGKNISESKKGIPNYKNRSENNGNWKPLIEKKCLYCLKTFNVKPFQISKKYCCIRCNTDDRIGKTFEQYYGSERAKKIKIKQQEKRITWLLQSKSIQISKAEKIFENYLKENNINYQSQYRYGMGIADFYLPDKNLIIECNGSYWHSRPDYIKRDKRKYNYLDERGYNVLIYCSEDIVENKNDLNKIIDLKLIR